jgi:hypothetical protein
MVKGPKRRPKPRSTLLAKVSRNLLVWNKISLLRYCRRTLQSKSEAAERQLPLVEAPEAKKPPMF